MDKKKLRILGLSYSQTQSGAYALVLAEEDGKRRIPIIIGAVEAQAIAIQLEGLRPPRPLTHDLFYNTCMSFGIELQEVFVYKLGEGIFYAQMVCTQNEKQIVVDSRTSDAIALALRFGCEIFTTEEILEKAGIVLDTEQENSGTEIGPSVEEKEDTVKKVTRFSKVSIDTLKQLLVQAIENEDYEQASEIRDELNKRKESS